MNALFASFCRPLCTVAAVLCSAPLPAVAQQASGLPPELIIRDWLKPPFKVATVSRGGMAERELGVATPELLAAQSRVVSEARRLFEQNPAIGLLLIEKDGSVLFEAYKHGADRQSVLIGYSMSKSATSAAVGHALCDGTFKSIDDPAERYSRDLESNAYGQATLRNLLNLASGGKKGEQAGQAVPGLTSDLLRAQSRTIRAGFKEFGSGGSSAATPGELSYKNYDTYALGVALSDTTKRPAHLYFAETIWSRIGAQSDAAWLLDRNGDTSTAEGFGATLRDWGRFAMYLRDQLATDSSSCFGNYVRQATTKRIANGSQMLTHFRGYGFGFWTDNYLIRAPSFWMTGFAGQRIGVDPVSGRVLVVIAHADNFATDVYRLFDLWTKQ